MWHRRLAHLNPTSTKLAVDGLRSLAKRCDTCIRGKHRQQYEQTKAKRATKPFELVHSDLCGPFPVLSLGGSLYFMLLIDDCTRYTEVYFLTKKSDAPAKICSYWAWVLSQGYTITRIRSDNGGEYMNALLLAFFDKRGITFEPSPPYSQHKNGV